MNNLPVFLSRRIQMQILSEASANRVLDYYLRNRSFHQPWFAARNDKVFTLEQQKYNLKIEYADFLAGRALPFWLTDKNNPERIIGRFALTNIIHGCFRSAIASWHLDKDYVGGGFAHEAGTEAIRLAFKDFRLHRIEANILPHNRRSVRLAQSLGFELTGYEKRYLEINGSWEDHLHFVRLADGNYYDENEYPVLQGSQVLIRALNTGDIINLKDYFKRNSNHLQAYNPALSDELLTDSYWYKQLVKSHKDWENGSLINLGIFLADRPDRLIGCIDIKDILMSPYNSCEIGYSLDSDLIGQGLMLESINLIIGWIFSHLNIKRIHARYIAGNERSEKLLSLLGFKQEGIQRSGINTLDGRKDLILSSLLADEYRWVDI